MQPNSKTPIGSVMRVVEEFSSQLLRTGELVYFIGWEAVDPDDGSGPYVHISAPFSEKKVEASAGYHPHRFEVVWEATLDGEEHLTREGE